MKSTASHNHELNLISKWLKKTGLSNTNPNIFFLKYPTTLKSTLSLLNLFLKLTFTSLSITFQTFWNAMFQFFSSSAFNFLFLLLRSLVKLKFFGKNKNEPYKQKFSVLELLSALNYYMWLIYLINFTSAVKFEVLIYCKSGWKRLIRCDMSY